MIPAAVGALIACFVFFGTLVVAKRDKTYDGSVPLVEFGDLHSTSDADFSGMCRGFGVDGYDDPRVATITERARNRDAMQEIMARCYDAAAKLSSEGVEAEVLDLRSLAPLDRETILESVAKTSRALLLHEATRTGGIGGELAAIIAEEAFEYLDAPIVRVASADTPVPYSPPLEAAFLPNVDKVVEAAKRLVKY